VNWSLSSRVSTPRNGKQLFNCLARSPSSLKNCSKFSMASSEQRALSIISFQISNAHVSPNLPALIHRWMFFNGMANNSGERSNLSARKSQRWKIKGCWSCSKRVCSLTFTGENYHIYLKMTTLNHLRPCSAEQGLFSPMGEKPNTILPVKLEEWGILKYVERSASQQSWEEKCRSGFGLISAFLLGHVARYNPSSCLDLKPNPNRHSTNLTAQMVWRYEW